MKHFLYRILQGIVRIGFFFYYRRLRIHGMERVEWAQPMLLLPNHQNALIDPLIIAAFAPKKTYFLTRSDVFVNAAARAFFDFLRMLPIYRMRDGRENLSLNNDVFDRCGELLAASETILVFPEANHNIQRRVRPLSKGFTRILFHAIDKHPDLKVLLYPLGVNYTNASGFPDSVAFYFGEAYAVTTGDINETERERAARIKDHISGQLKQLTTHIPFDIDYNRAIAVLDSSGTDYLNPGEVNALLSELSGKEQMERRIAAGSIISKFWRGLFYLLNAPLILIWRFLVKPKVEEPEFISTHRFLFALVFYPLAYLLSFWVLIPWLGFSLGLSIICGHILFNLAYVKLS